MKPLFFLMLSLSISTSTVAQQILSLDSCRSLAISNNKELMMSSEQINAAYYERKAAFTNYLPKVAGTAIYNHQFRRTSLISNEVKSALNQMGTTANASIQEVAQAMASSYPDLTELISSLGNSMVDPLNSGGAALANALQPDMRNMYIGAVTLTQPIYVGGKIRAYHKITRYTEELARTQHQTELQEVILNTDQAYWQIISLANKKKLAEKYLRLLQKTDSDMEKMITEGVATKADGLSVRVKVNEAEMTLTKVDNGLSLAKMVLCQLCGLPLNLPLMLEDELKEDLLIEKPNTLYDINNVYATRPEIKSLELGTAIYKQKINLTRSEFLPSLALTGGYMVSNPSIYYGFEKKFRGAWSVGVSMHIPLWNWGEGGYKVRAAKAEARMAEYKLADNKEKVELQVSQSVFKVNEADKKLRMAHNNMEKANENLRYATLGFEEGVIPTLNLLEAQTAWLSAHSEKIDAQIDMKLADVYLRKSMGVLHATHE